MPVMIRTTKEMVEFDDIFLMSSAGWARARGHSPDLFTKDAKGKPAHITCSKLLPANAEFTLAELFFVGILESPLDVFGSGNGGLAE
jgi:hypothetical protein